MVDTSKNTPKPYKFAEQMEAISAATVDDSVRKLATEKAAHAGAIDALLAVEKSVEKMSDADITAFGFTKKELSEQRADLQVKYNELTLPAETQKLLRDNAHLDKVISEQKAALGGNAALTEGLANRAMAEGLKDHGVKPDATEIESKVKELLGDKLAAHAETQPDVKAAIDKGVETALHPENFKASIGSEAIAATARAAAGTSAKEETGAVKSFVARLTREKEMVAARWNHGVDARTAEEVGFAKGKVALGGAVTGLGLVDGARRVYNGIAGEENPDTGKKESSFVSVALGAGEMAGAVALGRKMASGQAFGR